MLSARAEGAKSGDRPAASSAGGVFRGSKRTCADRARWRLVRGQSPQRLSDHYKLDCDYGMSILAIYKEGDAVFLCENHVTAIAPKDSCFAGVRPVEVNANSGAQAITADCNREQPAEIAAETRNAEATAEAAALTSEAAQFNDEIWAKPTDCEPEAAQASAPMQVQIPSPAVDGERAEQKPPTQTVEPAHVVPSAADVEKAAAQPPSPKTQRSVTAAKAPVRDLAYGNPAKALVDETIWNMAPGDLAAYRAALEQGKSPLEAAQAAGGQLAVVHRKIAEYTAKIEPILSASQATISIAYAIDKPLEQAILEIIGNDAMADAEKDAAVERLGAFQKQIKSGLETVISPLQAHHVAREIGERARSRDHASEIDQVKQAYRAVHSRLRDALRAFVPEARELDERLTNLYAAKSDLENPRAPKTISAAAV